MRARRHSARFFVALSSVIALLTASVGVSGCGAVQPTSITLNVRTDLTCDVLKAVSITVSSPEFLDEHAAQTVTTACTTLDRGLSSVGTLVIVPGSANDAEVGARVMAGVTRVADRCTVESGFRGCIVARRLLRFIPEQEIEITIDLRAECQDHACDRTSTCVGGACVSALVDPNGCVEASCTDETLTEPPPPVVLPDGGIGPGPGLVADAGADVGPDTSTLPPACAADEKTCGGVCTKIASPETGCTPSGCIPCAGSDSTVFTCDPTQGCLRSACKAGFKLCGSACVPSDAAHGCGLTACAPCDSTNGSASCGAGVCALECSAGYKLCGGRCVKIDDPTYGCSATACTNDTCPNPGAGTLVCSGTSCITGPCPAGTKACAQKCVPVDANNGCEDPARCTACGAGERCSGAPTTCQCQPESVAVTCASKACGSATNNCGQVVQCTDTCPAVGLGYVCGGAFGPSMCSCTPDNAAACAGKACGSATNNCGQIVQCTDTCPSIGFRYACSGNSCVCIPLAKTSACAGQNCGSAPDECGGYYTCGTCTGGRQCRCEFVCMFANQQCF